jgi:hypothetical protein
LQTPAPCLLSRIIPADFGVAPYPSILGQGRFNDAIQGYKKALAHLRESFDASRRECELVIEERDRVLRAAQTSRADHQETLLRVRDDQTRSTQEFRRECELAMEERDQTLRAMQELRERMAEDVLTWQEERKWETAEWQRERNAWMDQTDVERQERARLEAQIKSLEVWAGEHGDTSRQAVLEHIASVIGRRSLPRVTIIMWSSTARDRAKKRCRFTAVRSFSRPHPSPLVLPHPPPDCLGPRDGAQHV